MIDEMEGDLDLFHPITFEYVNGGLILNSTKFHYALKDSNVQNALKSSKVQLNDIQFTDGLLATVVVPAASVKNSSLTGGVTSLKLNLEDLLLFYQNYLSAAFLAGKSPNEIIKLIKENSFKHTSTLNLTLNWVGGGAQNFIVEYPQWNLLLNGYSLSASTNVFSFETRTKYSVNLDFGLIGYRGNKDFFGISPFYGVNVEFRYLDGDFGACDHLNTEIDVI